MVRTGASTASWSCGHWTPSPGLLRGTAAALVQGSLGGSIYTLGAKKRGILLSRGAPALRDLSVAQALDPVDPIAADLPFAELLALVGPTQHAAFPVWTDGAVVGLLSVREARLALLAPAVDKTATARSFTRQSPALLPDDDLGVAVQRLAEAGVGEALVLDEQRQPRGIVNREGVLEGWRRATGS